MRLIGKNSGLRVAGYVAGTDYSLSLTPRTRLITPGSTSYPTVKDANVMRQTSSIVVNEFDVNLTIPFGCPVLDQTIINQTPSVVSINSDTLAATRLTDGTAEITVSSRMGDRTVTAIVVEVGGANFDSFVSWVSGSLAKSITDTINTSLSGKTASPTSYDLFSTENDTSGIYVRNTALWASDFDFTCLAAWTNTSGRNWGGTLISPRHVMFANHAHPGNGATMRFIAANGTVVSRTLTTTQQVTGSDTCVGCLDSDVSNNISFAKVLPATFLNYLPQIGYGIPVAFSNQFKELHVNIWSGSDYGTNVFSEPTDSTQKSFYTPVINGDSGSPIFLLIGATVVLITCWWSADSGPSYASELSAIDAVMTILGGGYTTTPIDLSAYTSY